MELDLDSEEREEKKLVEKQQDQQKDSQFIEKLCICASQIVKSLKQLENAPKTLWITFILKFFASYSYFSTSLNLVLYLSEDFQYSDQTAGWYYGLFGILTTIYGLMCGFAVDWIGVRRSLIIGSIICAIGRFLLAFTVSYNLMYLGLFLFMPFGEALGIPVMTIAIRRTTTEQNRKQAYGLFYTFMNIAALLCGPLTDFFRSLYGGDNNNQTQQQQQQNSDNPVDWSPSRLVFLSAGISQVMMLIVTIYFYKIEEVLNKQSNEQGQQNKIITQVSQACQKIFSKKDFWRLVVCSGLLIFVKLLFRHLDATLPKYMLRTIGEDAKFGSVYSINPLMIIFLVPFIQAYAKDISSFTMIYNGSWLAAISPFFLVFGSSYINTIGFVVTLSLGEAVYSPPTYQYSMELAPEGEEGMYTTLANAPLFAAKFIAGFMSGYLLQNYCPEEGEKHCYMVWFIIGLTTLSSPILMTIFRSFIDPKIFRKFQPQIQNQPQELELNDKQQYYSPEKLQNGEKINQNYNKVIKQESRYQP